MRIFKEEQRFTQLWLIVLMAVSLVVPVVVLSKEYAKENSSLSTSSFVTAIVMILASGAIIFLFKLTTRIDEKGIHYKFFPFHFKTKLISWKEITNAYVRTYDPISEYGGWGLKGGALWNSKKGRAINVSGDIGIQLELADGKKILIGTQKRTEAESVLHTYSNKMNKTTTTL